jgi:hypothetical protein
MEEPGCSEERRPIQPPGQLAGPSEGTRLASPADLSASERRVVKYILHTRPNAVFGAVKGIATGAQ